MRMRRLIVSLLLWGGLLLSLFLPMTSAEPKKESMSMEEFLEYTVSDLTTQMQDVVRENNTMKSRNSALRKRILLLRQEQRTLENQKIKLLEGSLELTDTIKLKAREINIDKEKLQGLKNHGKEFEAEKKAAKQQMEKEQNEHKALREKLLALEGEVQELKVSLQGVNTAEFKREYEIEKHKFMQLVKEERSHLRREQKRMSSLENSLKNPEARKRLLAQEQAVQEEQLIVAKAELEFLREEEGALQEEASKLSHQQLITAKEANQGNQQIKAYALSLKQEIEAMNKVQAAIEAQFASHTKEMREFKISLAGEHKLLNQQIETLKEGLRIARTVKDQVEKKKDSQSLDDEAQEEYARLNQEKQDLKTQISTQVEKKQLLIQQEDALKKENADLRKDLKELKRQEGVLRADKIKKKQRELGSFLKASLQSNRLARDEIKQIERATNQEETQLVRLEQEQQDLKKEILVLKEEVEGMTAEEASLGQRIDQLKSRSGVEQDRMETEIDTLKLRRSVLTNSLQAIATRYTADVDAIKEFNQEEHELSQYLTVLRTENESLEARVKLLTSALEELRGH